MNRITIGGCKPGEPQEYCKMRETMIEIEKTLTHISTLNSQAKEAGLSDYEIMHDYDFENNIEKTKNQIMENVFTKELKKISPNIKIDYEKRMQEFKKMDVEPSQMDFEHLISKLKENFGTQKEEIAFEQLLDLAQKLRPYSGSIERQKTKLILRHGNEHSIEALSKLTSVIIDGINPSEAVESGRVVDSKVYVKDRVDVKFDKEETAEKMRKVLKLL